MIIAFAGGFFILFEGDEINKEGKVSSYLTDTILWSVGEIDYDDKKQAKYENGYSFFANLFVLTFFFLIVLVFMNFLNGLAVSDVRGLKEEAEIRGHSLRVDMIYHTGTEF